MHLVMAVTQPRSSPCSVLALVHYDSCRSVVHWCMVSSGLWVRAALQQVETCAVRTHGEEVEEICPVELLIDKLRQLLQVARLCQVSIDKLVNDVPVGSTAR